MNQLFFQIILNVIFRLWSTKKLFIIIQNFVPVTVRKGEIKVFGKSNFKFFKYKAEILIKNSLLIAK